MAAVGSQTFTFDDDVNSTTWVNGRYQFEQGDFAFEGLHDYPYSYGVNNSGVAYSRST